MQGDMRLIRRGFLGLLVAGGALLGGAHSAAAFVIDFEGLADFDPITNQYAALGVSFSGGAVAAVAFPDGTLNEIDFPPTSGITVLTNESGPVSVQFAGSGLGAVSGQFITTDLGLTGQPLTVQAFSPTDTINPLGTLLLSENLGSPAPLGFSGIGPIGSLVISPAQGGFFTLDDLSGEPFQPEGPGGDPVVPEPSSLILLGGALIGTLARRKRRPI